MGILRKAVVFKRFASGEGSLFGQSKDGAAGVTPEELQPLLRTLLKEPTLETKAAVDVLSKLKTIASRCGPFLTASEIQRCLADFAFKAEDGRKLDGTRAYELAAKLHWEYVHREIELMDKKSRRLGATVYAVFVEEMIECLLRGEDPLKAIEIPIVLADELLAKVFKPSPHTGAYFVLAERTVGAAHDGYKQWIDTKKRLLNLDRQDGNGSELETDPAFFAEAQALVAYLKQIEKSLHDLSQELGEIRHEPDDSEAGLEAHASYLDGLLGMAKSAGYASFTAMVMEQCAESRKECDVDECVALLQEAAQLYESQARTESNMKMPILSERRMKDVRRLGKLSG